MSNDTTENFLKIMSEFHWPEPVPVTYRLYYNDDGTPKCYTMDDLPGKYVEVDRETYISHLWNVRVVDSKLKILPITKRVNKLCPDIESGTPCHVQDVCVVVESHTDYIKWNMKDYEVN